MEKKFPRSPFSTRLSGSAKEMRLRVQNIMQGPKKRPPLWLMALTALAALLCGGLVSCQPRQARPSIAMETQYYDSFGNYIEIPVLTVPGGAEPGGDLQAINGELAEIKEAYAPLMDAPENTVGGNQCLFYPSTTRRYLNLALFQNAADYGNDGDIRAWVYDLEEDRRVTEEEALSLAGVTREELLGGLERLCADDPEDPRAMYAPAELLGFRIREDGSVVFYLSAYVDARYVPGEIDLDGWYRLYLWEAGTYARYDCMFTLGDQYPLVPQEETDRLSPPLWNQWYFAGEEPEGGFTQFDGPQTVREAAQAFADSHAAVDGNRWKPVSLRLSKTYGGLSRLSLAQPWAGREDLAVECYSCGVQAAGPDGLRLDYEGANLVFLRQGAEYTYLGRFPHDFQGVIEERLDGVAEYNFRVLNLLLEQGVLSQFPDLESMLREGPVSLPARAQVLSWLDRQSWVTADAQQIYFAGGAPAQPQMEDVRIDRLEFAGLARTYGTYGAAYWIETSVYGSRDGSPEWSEFFSGRLVLGLDDSGRFDDVRGTLVSLPEKSTEAVILEQTYGLLDLEVSLWRDGQPNPVGPGASLSFSCLDTMGFDRDLLDDWEPLYNEGDSWVRYRGVEGDGGFTALCYYNSAEERESINTLDATMPALFTYRGVRVGDSREQVLAAYPTAIAGNYWGNYSGEDMLYFIPGLDPEQSDGFWDELGPALLFFFQGDRVRQITLTNMFN